MSAHADGKVELKGLTNTGPRDSLSGDHDKSSSGGEEGNVATKPDPPSPWHPSQFPEGGFEAWLVVVGAFSCVFCSFGWINCGTDTALPFLRHALTVILYDRYRNLPRLLPNESASKSIPKCDIMDCLSGAIRNVCRSISPISSLTQSSCTDSSKGPIIGRFYDRYGPRYILLFGTFFHVFGLMMMSISTEYYQFILSQGVCSPIGISCLFTPCGSLNLIWKDTC